MEKRRQYALLGLIFISAFLGCGQIGGSGQCGGVSESGVCVKIESIKPLNQDGKETPNVDAFQTLCDSGNADQFFDHSAKVKISNTTLSKISEKISNDVTLTQYTIEYRLNSCPAGETCPSLDPVTISNQIFIPADDSSEQELTFVDIAKKIEYGNKGGTKVPSSYSAVYTFSGTDTFNNKVAVSGAAEFTIGDFNTCK